MATTDWKFAGTGESINDGGAAWSNPGNIVSSNNSYATANLGSIGSTESDSLRATSFGFTTSDIPDGSTIVGIEVGIEKDANGTGAGINDVDVFLRTSGGRVGTNHAVGGNWPTSDAETIYGGAADNWSAGLNDATVRSADFGCELTVARNNGTSVNARVDAIRIRITYTEAGGGAIGIGLTKSKLLERMRLVS